MTKVLLVGSLDSDCGVSNFKDYNSIKSLSLQDWVDRLEKSGVAEIIDEEIDWKDFYFSVELFEFGDVDKEFIKFIDDNIKDYDLAKDVDFFIVE